MMQKGYILWLVSFPKETENVHKENKVTNELIFSSNAYDTECHSDKIFRKKQKTLFDEWRNKGLKRSLEILNTGFLKPREKKKKTKSVNKINKKCEELYEDSIDSVLLCCMFKGNTSHVEQ